MMLILNSQMDTHFNFNNLHDLSEWQKYMNEAFLDNGEIFPPGMNGVLSILKETFRVLSFEQTPQ